MAQWDSARTTLLSHSQTTVIPGFDCRCTSPESRIADGNGARTQQTIVNIQRRRTEKRSGKAGLETRYYLSSQKSEARTPEEWINLTRSH